MQKIMLTHGLKIFANKMPDVLRRTIPDSVAGSTWSVTLALAILGILGGCAGDPGPRMASQQSVALEIADFQRHRSLPPAIPIVIVWQDGLFLVNKINGDNASRGDIIVGTASLEQVSSESQIVANAVLSMRDASGGRGTYPPGGSYRRYVGGDDLSNSFKLGTRYLQSNEFIGSSQVHNSVIANLDEYGEHFEESVHTNEVFARLLSRSALYQGWVEECMNASRRTGTRESGP